jgi:sister-chromatid-cohesion protein PDS5
VDNGDTISDNTEAELEHSEPTPKKGKVDSEKRGKGGTGTGTGVIIKGPSRGGRKSVDKNESAKKAGKKVELEKEGEEELDDNTPKRKRGRPKGSGKKDEGLPRSLTESGKKRGRPAKAKEEDVQEKSAQKKDKVHGWRFVVGSVMEWNIMSMM